MESKRVVVTGLGAITPIGNTVKDFWEGLVNGKNGAGDITRFDSALYKTHFACEVKGYNPDDFFDKKTARKYDLFAQFAIVAADEAIADSGITPENTDYDDVGVLMTSGIGGVNHFYHELKEFFLEGDGAPRFSPFLITKMIANMAAGVISIKYGFCGPNFATVSACASSSHAIMDKMLPRYCCRAGMLPRFCPRGAGFRDPCRPFFHQYDYLRYVRGQLRIKFLMS